VTGALLALLLTAADPCAPVVAEASPDPAAAAAYRQIGDDERAAGSAETAAVAYRAAAARDPADAASRRALQALCAGASAPADPFQDGLRLMEAQDFRAAAAAFAEARGAGGDLSAALLEGICEYRLGRDEAAARLLRAAEARPEHADLARFYLGLLALRAGAGAQASALFAQASGNRTLGVLAADLSRVARENARLVVTLAAEAGADSNPTLAPTSATSGGRTGAMMMNGGGLWGLGGQILYRPTGPSGPYLRGAGSLRQLPQLQAYDLGGLEAAAGWQLGGDGRGALAEYAYAYRTFGDAPYLSAHRLTAAGWLVAGGLAWSARYAAHFEDYPSASLGGYSGVLHRAEARAALPVGAGGLVALAYGLGRDATRLAITSYLEHGPRAEWRALVGPRLRLGLSAGVTFRDYDAFDAVVGVTRRDRYLDGAALAEWDLGEGWTAHLALEGRRALSNAAAFEYDRVVPTVGIAWQLGL
jgi:hypothetical protein